VTVLPPIRVLVVDDHAMFGQSLVRILSDEPDLVVLGPATTASQALDQAVRDRPDVVVLDFGLPDADGATVARGLARVHPGVQVLILTGLSDQRVLIDAIDSGCAGFLTKDRAVDELVDAVRLVAAGESYVPSELLGQLIPRLRRGYRGLGDDLTPREIDVLQLCVEGLSNKGIAERLGLSVNTVRNHVQNAITKLHAHSKLEVVAIAVREGIVRRES